MPTKWKLGNEWKFGGQQWREYYLDGGIVGMMSGRNKYIVTMKPSYLNKAIHNSKKKIGIYIYSIIGEKNSLGILLFFYVADSGSIPSITYGCLYTMLRGWETENWRT